MTTCEWRCAWDAGEQTSGTMEFYMMQSNVSQVIYMYIKDGGSTKFGLMVDGGKLYAYANQGAGAANYDIGAPTRVNNQWYHISIRWESTAGGYQGLAEDEFKIFVDGVEYGDYGFASAGDPDGFAILTAGSTQVSCYWDAFSGDWVNNYSLGDNLDLITDQSITNTNIYSFKIKHAKEDFIRAKAKFHQDEGVYVGAEINVSDLPYTCSQTTQNTWSYKFLVTDKDERYPPTYILESKLREIDNIHSKQTFTAKEVDYILEHICQSDLNHGNWGGLSQTLVNSLTITLGGDLDVRDILDDAIKLQGFTWYETPNQSGANTNLIYFREAGENASGVSITEAQSYINGAVTGMKRAHDVFNRVEVDGSEGASGEINDQTSQNTLGINAFTERATLLNNQTVCNAMGTSLISFVLNPPKRIRIRGKWKGTDYGMLQPGETVSFGWNSTAWDVVDVGDYIIESFEMDLISDVWIMILQTTQTYYMTRDIQRKNSHMIEQNRNNINENDLNEGITTSGAWFLKTSNDGDDYLEFSTAAGVPYITIQGGNQLKIDGGNDTYLTLEVDDDGGYTIFNGATLKLGLYWNEGGNYSYLYSVGTIRLYASADDNDYLEFSSDGTYPQIGVKGGSRINFKSIDTDDCRLYIKNNGIKYCYIGVDTSDDATTFFNTSKLRLQTNGDTDDYWQFTTSGNYAYFDGIGGGHCIRTDGVLYLIVSGDPDDGLMFYTSSGIPHIQVYGGTAVYWRDSAGGAWEDLYADLKDQASAITLNTFDKIKAVRNTLEGKVDYSTLPVEIETIETPRYKQETIQEDIYDDDNNIIGTRDKIQPIKDKDGNYIDDGVDTFTDVGDMMYFNLSAIKELVDKIEELEARIKTMEEKQ